MITRAKLSMNRLLIAAMLMGVAAARAEDVEIASNNNIRIFLAEDTVWRGEDTMYATVYGVTHDGMLPPEIVAVSGCLPRRWRRHCCSYLFPVVERSNIDAISRLIA